jgi:hypothetical protein
MCHRLAGRSSTLRPPRCGRRRLAPSTVWRTDREQERHSSGLRPAGPARRRSRCGPGSFRPCGRERGEAGFRGSFRSAFQVGKAIRRTRAPFAPLRARSTRGLERHAAKWVTLRTLQHDHRHGRLGPRAARTRESFYMQEPAEKLFPGEPPSSRAGRRFFGSARSVIPLRGHGGVLYIRRGCGIQGAPTGNARCMPRRWRRRQQPAHLVAICEDAMAASLVCSGCPE